MTSQLLVGNLDYETALARGRGIHLELPQAVRRMLAALSTLMAALGRDGDQLWTIEPVRRERIPALGAALPNVALIAGVLPEAASRLYWGDPAAAAYNDRRYGLTLAEALGATHPGTRMIDSVAALQVHLDAGGADFGARFEWVVKAPLSASGRHRLRRRGRELDEPSRTRLQRLLMQFGALLFEPWVERTDDYGCCGHVDDAGPRVFEPHLLVVDRAGVFRGIDTGVVATELAQPLRDSAQYAGEALHRDGYRGPFGIDAYMYRAPDGQLRLRSFCELNARHSFGHIARALALRLGEPVQLRAGRGEDVPTKATVLVAPSYEDPTAAWLSTK